MKKLIFLSVCILPLVAFTNCNNRNKVRSASDCAREYAQSLQDQNYDFFVDRIYFEDITPDVAPVEVKARKTTYANNLRRTHEPYVRERGGIKNVNVVSENKSKDGKNADVVVRHTYNNGQTEDLAYNLALIDSEWKIKTGPNREVWKTRMPDGTHVGFKIKDNDNKDVYKEHIGDERDFVKVKENDDKLVIKVKDDGEKDVLKIKDKGDRVVVKEKHDGDKERRVIDKDDM